MIPAPGFDPEAPLPAAPRFRAALVGAAIGDALGAPFEFLRDRDVAARLDPSPLEMRGGGRYKWLPGEWSDDTAMSLAVAEGLLAAPLDFERQVEAIGERFLAWLASEPKDVGSTIHAALSGFHGDWPAAARATMQARTGQAASNGSLMRALPVALAIPGERSLLAASARLSAMTHWDARAETCCAVYVLWIRELLAGVPRLDAWRVAVELARAYASQGPAVDPALAPGWIAADDPIWARLESVPDRPLDELQPTGYAGFVVDCLEAAVALVLVAASFEETLERAVRLGGEADTIAAVAGGAAAIVHGPSSIPERWAKQLVARGRIERVGAALAALRHAMMYRLTGLPEFSIEPVLDGLWIGRNPLTDLDVEELVRRGVRRVVDLREPSEWTHANRFGRLAVAAMPAYGLERVSVPMMDFAAPSPEQLGRAVKAVLETLDGTDEDPPAPVYLHCRAGIQRTGSVVVALHALREDLAPWSAAAELHFLSPRLRPLPEQLDVAVGWVEAERASGRRFLPSRAPLTREAARAAGAAAPKRLPRKRRRIDLSEPLELAPWELRRVLRGGLRSCEGDGWLLLWENLCLHCHHRRTGFEIYRLSFEIRPEGGARLDHLLANRDPKQHPAREDPSDLVAALDLLSRLTGRRPPEPGT